MIQQTETDMKLTAAIKKAQKITGQEPIKNGQFYFFSYKGHSISFAVNGRLSPDADATNYKTSRNGQEDDVMTDYFCGTFHDNLSQAFKFIERMGN